MLVVRIKFEIILTCLFFPNFSKRASWHSKMAQSFWIFKRESSHDDLGSMGSYYPFTLLRKHFMSKNWWKSTRQPKMAESWPLLWRLQISIFHINYMDHIPIRKFLLFLRNKFLIKFCNRSRCAVSKKVIPIITQAKIHQNRRSLKLKSNTELYFCLK